MNHAIELSPDRFLRLLDRGREHVLAIGEKSPARDSRAEELAEARALELAAPDSREVPAAHADRDVRHLVQRAERFSDARHQLERPVKVLDEVRLRASDEALEPRCVWGVCFENFTGDAAGDVRVGNAGEGDVEEFADLLIDAVHVADRLAERGAVGEALVPADHEGPVDVERHENLLHLGGVK